MDDWENGGFGIYLHWPFCQSKCPYCDFNSHVAASIDQTEWRNAYLTEIDRLAGETGDRILSTIYFGGGTPSLMEPALVEAILGRIRSRWRMSNDAEITLEANPSSVESHRFYGYREAGVNRISMGIQALNDGDLGRLGRLHSTKEALNALDTAFSVFDRVSFDLIYARQDQTLAQWESELRRALSYAADHLSLYQLTIEDGTPFAARRAKGGLAGLPDEERSIELFEATQEICNSAGLPAYEVSNHARPGSESRHNLIYWRGGDYVGIGPGAHGRLTLAGTRWATECPRSPDAWLRQVREGYSGEAPRQALSALDHAEEYLMMSLRLAEGLDLGRLEKILCQKPAHGPADEMLELGLLRKDGQYLIATAKGRLLLNGIIAKLATALG